jgi:hypothetical protein
MTPENAQRLFERFDHLYRGRHLPLTQNLMSDGFDCGDGWYDLLYELSAQLEAYCQEHPEAGILIAVQVKQKFGELRFYVNPHIPAVQRMINAVTEKSRQTCELTGQPGTKCSRQGYYRTLSVEQAQALGFTSVQSPSEQDSSGQT